MVGSGVTLNDRAKNTNSSGRSCKLNCREGKVFLYLFDFDGFYFLIRLACRLQ